MLKPQKYTRKPFDVDAVQVTTENLEEVARWCQGEVITTADKTRFIKVRVHHPLTERQTRAFPGDWILYAGTGYKVYIDKAFANTFDKKLIIEPEKSTSYDPADATPALFRPKI